MTATEADRIHSSAAIVDGTCPGVHWRERMPSWREGGVTCCVVTVAWTHSAREALRNLGQMYSFIRQHPELRLATSVADVRAAKERGQLAVVFHFQGAEAIEYEPALLEAFWRLGVRIVQLAYNRRNPLCDGCEEPADAGLSTLGRRAVAEMNRLGILVDVTHTGTRSALEAIAASAAPCVASHSNVAAVHANPRNISDELIRAIAASGGVIGINGFPPFVADSPAPTLDQFVDHIAHVAELVGPQHAGLAIDYNDETRAAYDALIASGTWSPATYPPPPWLYPEGIEDASGLQRVTERLLARGFGEREVRGILGENWLRVYGEVWG